MRLLERRFVVLYAPVGSRKTTLAPDEYQRRTAVRRRFAESKHRVYRDRSCVAALGEFLNRVARNGGCDGG
jgi:hypothetical protein